MATRLLSMSQLAKQKLSDTETACISPTFNFNQHLHCAICNGEHDNRKLSGVPLRILREKAILEDETGLEQGSKLFCSSCRVKLKRIGCYQNRIEDLRAKIGVIVIELKELANCDKVKITEVNSDGNEIELENLEDDENGGQFLEDGENILSNIENKEQGDGELISDFTAEDVVMKIESLPDPENEPDQLANVSDPNPMELEEDLSFKCEFEPEDVEVMSLQTQNFIPSSSTQYQNPENSNLNHQVSNSSKISLQQRFGHQTKAFVTHSNNPSFIKEILVNLDSRVICPECKIYFVCPLTLARHFKYSPKHASETAIKTCDKCSLEFPSLSKRIDHDQAKHPEMFNDRDRKRKWCTEPAKLPDTIKCGACGKEFYAGEGYRKHLVDNGCKGGVRCEQCPSVFRTLEDVFNHVRDAHETDKDNVEFDRGNEFKRRNDEDQVIGVKKRSRKQSFDHNDKRRN